MDIFGNGMIAVNGVAFLVFCVMAIAAVGYALGRITIKGVSLGDSGVFIVALLFGCLFFPQLSTALGGDKFTTDALKLVENLGLILFVTSVGFIAGPKFFGNLKKNFKSYVLLGLVIIIFGALAAVSCIYVGTAIEPGKEMSEITAMVVGLLSGSLTSTPAFSAAKASVATQALEDMVTVGHAISYIFGVLGVVLFVQLIPKMCKANMEEERAKLVAVENGGKERKTIENLFHFDSHGLMPFAVAAVLGVLIGSLKIPLSGEGWSALLSGAKITGATFSLTSTGGCLLMSLIFGHFGRIGRVNIMPKESVLKIFREFGLILFLIGAGVAGGAKFIEYFQSVYFLYGVWMTVLPMVVGYIFARYVLKLSLLNNLGSITGGMTSTPALGTLINVAGTEDVAGAYAATYPVALIAVVLVSQLLITVFR
jgi:putative transport protein